VRKQLSLKNYTVGLFAGYEREMDDFNLKNMKRFSKFRASKLIKADGHNRIKKQLSIVILQILEMLQNLTNVFPPNFF
jgi:hypothetical protein